MYSIHTAEIIVKLLSLPGSPTTIVFLIPGADIQFQGKPLQWGAKYTGVGKICDFRLISPFISEMAGDGPIVVIISYPIVSKPSSLDSADPCSSFSMGHFCAICNRLGVISNLGHFRVTPLLYFVNNFFIPRPINFIPVALNS